MRRLVSSALALAADRTAEERFGYPAHLLMEEAGIRLQDRLEALAASGEVPRGPWVYLAGGGNNGADALVMARQAFLRGRTDIAVVRVFPAVGGLGRFQDGVVRSLGIPVLEVSDPQALARLRSAVLWIDGIWGAGLSAAVREDRAMVLAGLEALREQTGRPCAAVDVPSGLWAGWTPGDPVLRARWTLAPGWAKDFGFFPESRPFSGLILEIPLAYPEGAEAAAELIGPEDAGALVPRISIDGHKGSRGHVAVLGGAEGMSGALVLAARSAAAAGAGLVSLGTDPGLVSVVGPQVPAFQVRNSADALGRSGRYGAWVVGPGWGTTVDRIGFVAQVLASGRPAVFDADALVAWAALGPSVLTAPVVLTPHPGEFARLCPGSGPSVVRAASLAAERKVTVVLKGAVTWILAPDGRRSVWDGPNPALGTGGSGDCLAGVVGAFLALGLDGYEAAQAAVVVHGLAGRSLADREGWFTADRLPDELARVSLACRTSAGTV